LYSPNDFAAEFKILGDVEEPEVEFKKSPGHFVEWVEAIKGGDQAMSNFTDYAGPLTETILLGNLAVWVANELNDERDGQKIAVGEKVEWDAKNLKVKNITGLENIVKPIYRDGYTLDA
ncbi:MAG: gfo/Idh/MocA family oxidoreductase, partial [Candidatus Nealsonbacteria bacterium]|nr:gfo/Idh/MocA family oxidoreductase [Candidatus Nealsonbacteria bacterium]